MNYINIILFMSFAFHASMQAMNEALQNAAIGGFAGATEIVINQPLMYFKNTRQRGDQIAWKSPKVWYRGCGMNIAAMGPTTAFQTGVNAGLKASIPGTKTSDQVARAFIAGVASASLCAPIDLIVLDQQKTGNNAARTIQRLVNQGGLKVLMRGWYPTALREGPWSAAYLAGFPIVQEYIKNKIDNPVAAHIGGYVGAGIITGSAFAVITHPIDTIKTVIQDDYLGNNTKTMRAAIDKIYRAGGIKAFFRGCTPRAINCGLAIPLIGTLTMYLSQKVQEHNSKDH